MLGTIGSIGAALGLGGGNVVNSVGSGLGNIFNEITGGAAKDRAIGAQTSATNSANQVLGSAYAQQQKYLNPYNSTGQEALASLARGNIMDGYKTSDGYQFQLAEGQKGINNALAARGLGTSGAAAKALTKYQTGLLAQDQQQYYNNEYNRLNQLAGMGQNAANNLSSAAGSYGANVANNYMGLGNANAAANIGQYNTLAGLAGQGAQAYGMGSAVAVSDRRLKQNIRPVPKEDLDELKSQLKAFYFEYKDKLHDAGRWVGIMAQDLEKSKLGKSIVVERNGKKMIDMHKVGSLFLATMAEAA